MIVAIIEALRALGTEGPGPAPASLRGLNRSSASPERFFCFLELTASGIALQTCPKSISETHTGCFQKLGVHSPSVLIIRHPLLSVCSRALIFENSHMSLCKAYFGA